MAVKLRKRKLRGKNLKSQYKFYLDIYSNGQRYTETINHLILNENDTKEERKEIEKQAEQIARVKEQQLFNEEYGMPSKNNQKIDFITYFTRLMKEKDEIKTQEAWNNTLNYLKEYSKGAIIFSKVNEEWLNGFIKYLQGKGLANNSIITYFNKITAALNQALREKKIFLNPAHNIQRLKKLETEKVNLSTQELQLIYNTPFYHEDVKRAFLFSCFTGLRVSDVMNLKWGNIKEKKKGNKKLTGINISQKKTKGFVYLPINKVAVDLMGKKGGEEHSKI